MKKLIIFLLIITSLPLAACGDNDRVPLSLDDDGKPRWRKIEECGELTIDYLGKKLIEDEDTQVEEIFNEFIDKVKEQDYYIYGPEYGNQWRYVSSERYGWYDQIKYWTVHAEWYSEVDDKWYPFDEYKMGEGGEITLMNDCRYYDKDIDGDKYPKVGA